jgi:hypothetical protein
METISLRGISRESKIELLRQIGLDSDGKYVLRDRVRLVDEYSGEKVTLENMLVLPGSTVVISDNPLSIAAYFEEHGDWD